MSSPKGLTKRQAETFSTCDIEAGSQPGWWDLRLAEQLRRYRKAYGSLDRPDLPGDFADLADSEVSFFTYGREVSGTHRWWPVPSSSSYVTRSAGVRQQRADEQRAGRSTTPRERISAAERRERDRLRQKARRDADRLELAADARARGET